MNDHKKEKEDDILNAGIAGSAAEVVQRYGDAAKQHYVAYSGRDNELGKNLVKGLKQISEEKVNPDYEFQNLHQQAGFSAEVKSVARSNAESIIRKDTTRKVRTDDLGRVNDPLHDTVTLDSQGRIIDHSGTQIKFIGASKNDPTGAGNATRALKKLQSKRFEKYLDADVKIEVPSDQYDQLIKETNASLTELNAKLEKLNSLGKTEQAQKVQSKINKLNTIKKNLRKSPVSSQEAMDARLHPKLSAGTDIAKISHRAGLETAQNAALIGGGVSLVRNVVAFCRNEIEAQEAVKNIAQDTATTAAVGYATGFTGSALKGGMQNSSSQYLRSLSKTNVAGTIVAVAVSASKTMVRYFNGEIDGTECLEDLGEQGTGFVASAVFTAIGQAAIPIPVVGGLIGGMVGYALSSASYGVLMTSLKEKKLAASERRLIEQQCDEYAKMLREYRLEMEQIINEYLVGSMSLFQESFSGIRDAFATHDVDWLIDSANTVSEAFGRKASFSSMEEFDEMMTLGSTFKL